MNNQHISMSREELYDLVWKEPRSQLAKRLGISDVGLAKRCRKLKIPMPGLGDWTKLQSGHKVPQPTLLPMENVPKIEFPGPSTADATVAQLKATLPSLTLPEELLNVPETLHGAHPIVRATRDALKGRSTDKYGRVGVKSKGLISINVSPALVNRALRIADGIFKVVVKLGGKIVDESGWNKTASVQLNGVTLSIAFEETARRNTRALTKSEEERHRRHPTIYSGVEYEWHPSRILSFKITEWMARTTRVTWTDRKNRPIDSNLREIVSGLIFAAELKRIQNEDESKERQLRQEAARRREEEEQIRRDEEKRYRNLLRDTHLWSLHKKVTAYADAIEVTARNSGHTISENSELGEWLLWARQKAHQLNPIQKYVTQTDPSTN